jgi:predicted AlkP superfamily pyrophosphatase or phosphodiesterase
MREGTTYAHGLVASFPSVTLANHTTALTGVHPGRHGVLHNFYFDRAAGRRIVTNAPEVWHLARDEIALGVETLFELIARAGGGTTVAINEPVDRGATYATFDALRTGDVGAVGDAIGDPRSIPGSTAEFVERKREFAWSSAADHLAVKQASEVWTARPRLMWVNLILPDAANHLGGPYADIASAGMRDTDARVGAILRAIDDERDTAFVVLADHGMEESDPACKGDWMPALSAAGLDLHDEGEGFLYFRA